MVNSRFWYILAMILIAYESIFNQIYLQLTIKQSLISVTFTIIYGGLMALSSKEK